jgi:hypothetical protein
LGAAINSLGVTNGQSHATDQYRSNNTRRTCYSGRSQRGLGYFPPTAGHKLDTVNEEFAIVSGVVGGVVALVAAMFAISGGHSWLSRFYEAQQTAQNFQKHRSYADLDEFYMRILNLAIEKPYLRKVRQVEADSKLLDPPYEPFGDEPHFDRTTLGLSPDPSTWSNEDVVRYYSVERAMTDYRQREYDAYAFMVWNFLETIHDRCDEHPELLNTWAPIIAAENEYHRGWFLQQMRRQAELRVKKGPAYIRSDKFCRDFQVFIYNCHFIADPEVSGSADAIKRYSKWSYTYTRLGREKQREFSQPPPTCMINGRPEKVWPEPGEKTTSVPHVTLPEPQLA